MKFVIPALFLLLLGIAVCLHRSPVPNSESRQTMLSTAFETASAKPTVQPIDSVQIPTRPNPPERKPEGAPPTRSDSVASWRKLSAQLERELSLTSIQKTAVEQVLKDRENEIRECHDAIRKSGLLDMRTYEWQVGQMKAAWYRRIDAFLDTAQHDRFASLADQGLFNEGLAFTHEPGMTILD